MWVPVWALIEIVETLHTSPLSMELMREMETSGSPGQWTMPLASGTETSIQPGSHRAFSSRLQTESGVLGS